MIKRDCRDVVDYPGHYKNEGRKTKQNYHCIWQFDCSERIKNTVVAA